MKIDVVGYSNRVIDDFTLNNNLPLNSIRREEFSLIILEIAKLIEDCTIYEYDVDILDGGESISVKVDIGYFNEAISDSSFVKIAKRCKRLEVAPARLAMITFVFDGVWGVNE